MLKKSNIYVLRFRDIIVCLYNVAKWDEDNVALIKMAENIGLGVDKKKAGETFPQTLNVADC